MCSERGNEQGNSPSITQHKNQYECVNSLMQDILNIKFSEQMIMYFY